MAVCFSHVVEEEDQVEWREKKRKQGTSRASHAQFLVRLATKIVAFFIKFAHFALMRPVGLLAAVAQLFTATSHYFIAWCESSMSFLECKRNRFPSPNGFVSQKPKRAVFVFSPKPRKKLRELVV